MKLYLLKVVGQARSAVSGSSYDCVSAMIVRAPNPRRARAHAASQHGDEGSGVWLNARTSECRAIGVWTGHERRPGVVMREGLFS